MNNPESISLNIDCMEYMATIPDKYFDLALVDPPYGIGFGAYNRTNRDSKGERFKANKYKQGDWDSSIPTIDYFMELKRVSINQIVWGGTISRIYGSADVDVLFFGINKTQ